MGDISWDRTAVGWEDTDARESILLNWPDRAS